MTASPSRAVRAIVKTDRIQKIKFFGRKKGRALSFKQAFILESGNEKYGLNVEIPSPIPLEKLFVKKVNSVHLEIGFGGGEHLVSCVHDSPETGFIGVEPFVNGLAKLMACFKDNPVENIRTSNKDAREILDWLPRESLSQIDLLYPDPWRKKKHWKRRFICQENLERMAKVLKKEGIFRFASDIEDYVEWTLIECQKSGKFMYCRDKDPKEPFLGWKGTRYESKALKEGRFPSYLCFRRL